MRHIRTRRRFKVILILLFIICFTVFVENRVEGLIPQLKGLVEAKVEDAMGGRMNFSIGSIGGGILHPVVLNDIRIKQKDGSQLVQSLVINRVRTNYYIKDIIRAIGGSELPPLLDKHSRTYISFSVKSGDIKGFIGLHGDFIDSRVDGYLIAFRQRKISFIGRIKDNTFEVEIRPERPEMGSITAVGSRLPDDTFIVGLKIDHLKLGGFDIACDALLKNKLVKSSGPSDPGHVEGKFETRNLKLNFKPFLDIKASYKLMKDAIEVPGLTFGDVMNVYGKVSLNSARNIDLTFLFNDMSLNWLMLMFGRKETASVVTGTMSGKFELKGPVKKIKMVSRFDIRGGTIGPFEFDYLIMSLKGELPFLKIEESRITRKSGYLELAGELDLRRIGRANMFDHIKLVTDDTAITWDEWSLTQGKDAREIDMKKNFGGQFGFGYKKFVREDRIDESLRDSDEVRFNYNLQPNDSLKVMVGQDKDFFGFEHKDEF